MTIEKSKRRLFFTKVRDFNPQNPNTSGELTQEICDVINARLPRKLLFEGKAVVAIFGQVPLSGNAKLKEKYAASIREATNLAEDKRFLKITEGTSELQIDVVFFLARDYERRDVDNMVKPLLDVLKGLWFKDDGRIKKIIAEKYHVQKIEEGVDKRFYEQIYCAISVLD